ncbi:MAG TPA: hypothetical protein VL026_09615 [Rhizomicrobium sp.]|nr:hypothetical protein [Rhizomicrobium sp.]
MPKTYAQMVGMFVTAIVVLGTDMDVLYAMPLGIMAGALSVFFVTLSERHDSARLRTLVSRRIGRYRP